MITGAATQVGTFNVVVSATNAAGTGSATVQLTVTGRPKFLAAPAPLVEPGESIQLLAVGTSIAAEGLPRGMQLDSATGLISGNGEPGLYNVTLTASTPYGSETLSWALEVSPVNAWGIDGDGRSTAPAGLGTVVALAAGGSHSLALRSDGTISAWGANYAGQSTVPAVLSGVVAVAAGGGHSLALKGDGTVVAWGADSAGQSTVPAGLSGVVAIAAGGAHSLALRVDGKVTAWGQYGQSTVPRGISGVVAIAAGANHSLALKADGTVVAWGDNFSGQSNVPPGLSGVVALAAGGDRSLTLKADGTVITWDRDSGLTALPGLSAPMAIAAGGGHYLGLKADGTVAALWSDVPQGLSGVVAVAAGSSHSLALSGLSSGPPVITSPQKWITEAAGARLSPARFHQRITATGSPLSYAATGLPAGLSLDSATGLITGAATEPGTFPVTLAATNAAGTGTAIVQLTVTGLPGFLAMPPSLVEPGDEVQLLALGTSTTATGLPQGLRIDTSSGLITGICPPGHYNVNLTVSNPYGSETIPWSFEVSPVNEWPNASSGISAVPPGLAGIVGISAGVSLSLALKANGTVVSWGRPGYSAPPVPANLSGVVALAQGYGHSLALRADGSVAAWGDNTYGQGTAITGLTGMVGIAAGTSHSMALRANGTVVAWGNNDYNQSIVPPDLTGVVAISAGDYHCLALKSDGTVTAWGSDFSYQTTIPPALSGVAAIDAGSRNSLALLADGTVASWGGGLWGLRNVPELSGVVSLSAQEDSFFALKADGTVATRGYYFGFQSMVPADLKKVSAIASGRDHSLALVQFPVAPVAGIAGDPLTVSYPPAVAMAQFSALGLPPGLGIHPTTGVISGAPIGPAAGVATITMSNRAVTRTETLSYFIRESAAGQAGGWAAWTAANWPGGGADSAPDADPDQDGVKNVLEYAVGSSPLAAGPRIPLGSARDEAGHLTLTLEVPADRAGLVTWQAQFADDADFASEASAEPEVVAGAPTGMVRLRFTDTRTGTPKRFGRIRIVEPQ